MHSNLIFIIVFITFNIPFSSADPKTPKCVGELSEATLNMNPNWVDIECDENAITGEKTFEQIIRQAIVTNGSNVRISLQDVASDITTVKLNAIKDNLTIGENSLKNSFPNLLMLSLSSGDRVKFSEGTYGGLPAANYHLDVHPLAFKKGFQQGGRMNSLTIYHFVLTDNTLAALNNVKDELSVFITRGCAPREKIAKLRFSTPNVISDVTFEHELSANSTNAN